MLHTTYSTPSGSALTRAITLFNTLLAYIDRYVFVKQINILVFENKTAYLFSESLGRSIFYKMSPLLYLCIDD